MKKTAGNLTQPGPRTDIGDNLVDDQDNAAYALSPHPLCEGSPSLRASFSRQFTTDPAPLRDSNKQGFEDLKSIAGALAEVGADVFGFGSVFDGAGEDEPERVIEDAQERGEFGVPGFLIYCDLL